MSSNQDVLREATQNLKKLFDKTEDATLIIQGDTFVDCNDATVLMLGARNKKEVINTHPSALSPEAQTCGQKSYDKANLMMAKAFEKGFHRFEWVHKKLSGEAFPVEVTLVVIETYSDSKKPLLWTTWKDLTSEKSLILEKEKLKSYVDKVSLISETDQRGIITQVNQEFCRISGFSENQLIGKSHSIINSGFHPKEFWQDMWKSISAGKMWRGKVKNRAKNGSFYWVDTTIFPLMSSTGDIYGHGSVRLDITENIKKEEIIEQQRKVHSLNSKLTSLGELAAGVGHEINNPLAIIVGGLTLFQKEMSKDSPNVAKIMPFLDKILQASDRINKIVDSLRIFAGRDSEQKEVVSLNIAIEQTLSMILNIYKKNGIELVTKIPNSELSIFGSYSKIQQVIMNLLSNAKDALEGVDNKQIHLEMFKQANNAIITIADNGLGIPEEIEEKIFQPFFTSKPVGQGTGLGLSLCKELTENMQGKISYEKSPDKGSKFVLKLPLINSSSIISDDNI